MEKHKPLALKTLLTDTKNQLMNKLLYEHDSLSVSEQKVYADWLNNINEIITICTERNKF